MRFLVKVVVPTAKAGTLGNGPQFEKNLQILLRDLAVPWKHSARDGEQRIEWFMVEIKKLADIHAVAAQVFRSLQLKAEFLPEVKPKPYFGR